MKKVDRSWGRCLKAMSKGSKKNVERKQRTVVVLHMVAGARGSKKRYNYDEKDSASSQAISFTSTVTRMKTRGEKPKNEQR